MVNGVVEVIGKSIMLAFNKEILLGQTVIPKNKIYAHFIYNSWVTVFSVTMGKW